MHIECSFTYFFLFTSFSMWSLSNFLKKSLLCWQSKAKSSIISYFELSTILVTHISLGFCFIVLQIEVLPEITKAVGDKLEVYIDGGITDGSDVFKALALGARMVFVGRPALWGLSYNGEEGVKKVLSILKKEFETTLLLTGKLNFAHFKNIFMIVFC